MSQQQTNQTLLSNANNQTVLKPKSESTVQVAEPKAVNKTANGTEKKEAADSVEKKVKANSENPFDKQFDLDLQRMEEDPLVFKEEENRKLNESSNLAQNNKTS